MRSLISLKLIEESEVKRTSFGSSEDKVVLPRADLRDSKPQWFRMHVLCISLSIRILSSLDRIAAYLGHNRFLLKEFYFCVRWIFSNVNVKQLHVINCNN